MKLTPNPFGGQGLSVLRRIGFEIYSEAVRATLEDVARDLEAEGEHLSYWDRLALRNIAARYRKAAEDL